MTDTTKHYINQGTGTIWAYMTETTETVVENNEYNPNYYGFNKRISSNDGTDRTTGANGRLNTDFIEINPTSPYNVTIKGLSGNFVIADGTSVFIYFYDASKAFLGYMGGVSQTSLPVDSKFIYLREF